MLQTSALWHAMTRSPQCKARCSKHISISDLLGYFLKSGTTERHLIVLWNFKSWSNMKFICNIPLNVTKYINNVKKKVKSIRKLLKNCIHYTHMQPKKHNIRFMCVSSEMSENDNCKSGLYQKLFPQLQNILTLFQLIPVRLKLR